MVMTYSHAKVQRQQSVGSEDRVKTSGRTDGLTDGRDCITSLANAVGKGETFYDVQMLWLCCTRSLRALRHSEAVLQLKAEFLATHSSL